MSETIGIGGLELRFLQTKDETADSLDAFEMIVQPNARMPVGDLKSPKTAGAQFDSSHSGRGNFT